MEHLKSPSPTRDIKIEDAYFGKYGFILSEGNMVLYMSPIFDSYESCLEEGIRYLDELHEVKPLLCNGKHFGGYYEQL